MAKVNLQIASQSGVLGLFGGSKTVCPRGLPRLDSVIFEQKIEKKIHRGMGFLDLGDGVTFFWSILGCVF